MLIPELDKLRDKSLSMGCLLNFKEEQLNKGYGTVFLYKYVRQGSSSSEGYDGYKLKKGDIEYSDMRNGEFKIIGLRDRNTMYWKPDEEGEYICDELVEKYFDVLGKPLTRGRIEYLHQTRNNDTDEYWSIHELFLFNPELYDKSELERMQSPHREELKKLLIQFSNYL